MIGNSVLYLPPDNGIVTAFENLIKQDELTPEWLSLSHRLSFAMKRLGGGSQRLSDLRIAIYGPPALTILARRSGDLRHALPKTSFYSVHSEPKRFFDPGDFSALIGHPEVTGFHISGKGRSLQPPIPGSLFAWAVEKFA